MDIDSEPKPATGAPEVPMGFVVPDSGLIVDPDASLIVDPDLSDPAQTPAPFAHGGARSDRDSSDRAGPAPPPLREQGSTITLPGMVYVDPDPAPSEDWNAAGFHFGKYELIEEIGRGGMGVVYKARQKDLDRVVALKMILSSHLASATQVSRFYTEAKAAARMSSPNIVRIHEVGSHNGQHYFAMQHMPGGNLAAIIRNGWIEQETAAKLVKEVARGVQHLHEQGVVHRDLKPSNILLDEAGTPSVTDFGLAKVLKGDPGHTHSGAIVGTPSYMAPEQASGGRAAEVGPASDIYSLGAILFELLTGRPPFRSENPLDTLVQVLEGEPPRPRRLRSGLARDLELICLKCLEKNPKDRYASAADLADDLERFLKKEQVEVKRLGPIARLRRWARREPALVSRLGTMGLCGAIIQINHSLFEEPDTGGHKNLIGVVVAWALASIGFQAMLRSERWGDLGRYAWAWSDVVCFTLMVYFNDGLSTSLVSGYLLLIAASGLWFRERLVHFTTIMSVCAYGTLTLVHRWTHGLSSPSPYRHVILASVLAVSGLIIAYQVKRVRALSQYYENRPLP